MNNTLNPSKKQEKREKLKNFGLVVSRILKAVDLESVFPGDYISENGHTKNDFSDMIDKISKCANKNTYLENTSVSSSGELSSGLRSVNGCSCGVYSLCPSCASKKRNEMIRDLRPYITMSRKLPVYLYSGTITIPSSLDPAAAYDKLRDSWTRFIKMGQLRDRSTGKRSSGEAHKIIGSVLSIEIVRSAECGYHVHGHVLMFCDSPLDYSVYDREKKKLLDSKYGKNNIPQDELDEIVTKTIVIPDRVDGDLIDKGIAVSKLSEQWYRASGAINFWVSPLHDGFIKGKQRTIEDQLYETLKYLTKSWDLSGPDMIRLWDTIHGKKRLTKSGIFTNNESGSDRWFRLLDRFGLVEEFNSLSCDLKEVSFTDNKCLREVFNYENYSYDYIEEECDYSYLSSPLYAAFLRDRARVINEYRSVVNGMVSGLKIARQMARRYGCFDVDPDTIRTWIDKKIVYKKETKKRIRDLITDFQRDICRLSPDCPGGNIAGLCVQSCPQDNPFEFIETDSGPVQLSLFI